MKKLTKAKKGLLVSFGPLTLAANLARTLIWSSDDFSENVGFKRDHYLFQIKYSRTLYGRALVIYILPLSLVVGWSDG